jgi:hypothetical protein
MRSDLRDRASHGDVGSGFFVVRLGAACKTSSLNDEIKCCTRWKVLYVNADVF